MNLKLKLLYDTAWSQDQCHLRLDGPCLILDRSKSGLPAPSQVLSLVMIILSGMKTKFIPPQNVNTLRFVVLAYSLVVRTAGLLCTMLQYVQMGTPHQRTQIFIILDLF